MVTVTFSPSAAVPHTGTGRSACSTPLSLMIAGSLTSAHSCDAQQALRAVMESRERSMVTS